MQSLEEDPLTAGIHGRMDRAGGDAMHALDSLLRVAYESTDPATLELCKLRIAALLDGGPDLEKTRTESYGPHQEKVAALATWWTSELFSEPERAKIAFTEQFVVSVHSMTDDDVDALLEYFSEEEVYQFVSAIYALDATTRARIVARAVFGDDGAAAVHR
jgi:alkylhydroperoxidase family enzyme